MTDAEYTDRFCRSSWCRPLFGSPATGFQPAFAWLPVQTIDGGWKWCRRVWRRLIVKYEHLDGGPDQWFQYAFRPPMHLRELME